MNYDIKHYTHMDDCTACSIHLCWLGIFVCYFFYNDFLCALKWCYPKWWSTGTWIAHATQTVSFRDIRIWELEQEKNQRPWTAGQEGEWCPVCFQKKKEKRLMLWYSFGLDNARTFNHLVCLIKLPSKDVLKLRRSCLVRPQAQLSLLAKAKAYSGLVVHSGLLSVWLSAGHTMPPLGRRAPVLLRSSMQAGLVQSYSMGFCAGISPQAHGCNYAGVLPA